MRKLLAAATVATILAGTAWTAGALVQWWSPKQKDCPTFDTQAQCTSFCTQNPASCGGDTTCVSTSGPSRPPC